MGNCFSSCFPKEDPETIALREENERRELQQARDNAAHAAEAFVWRRKIDALCTDEDKVAPGTGT